MEDENMEDKMTKKFLADMISLARGQLKTVEETILERCKAENDDMEEAFLFCLEALAGEYRQLRACNAAGSAKFSCGQSRKHVIECGFAAVGGYLGWALGFCCRPGVSEGAEAVCRERKTVSF